MDLKNNHALHGALAGVLVYALTRKPLPALVVGGGAYLYMATYGHALPPPAPQCQRTPSRSPYNP